MVTENIDIVVRERGARVVRRRLAEIGDVAERSVRGLRLLQNTLFVLGAAGAVAGLVRLTDTLTNFENRLKLVTSSEQQLIAVEKELFEIAIRTRSAYEGTAETFNRTALAVRGLGFSLQDTLRFTETLNKATILSGASVREANAAMIQLSQGLAAGRLNGDELRSVLEQLPFVADLIGAELIRLGVISSNALGNDAATNAEILSNTLVNTRGEMRRLGREGKLATDIVVDSLLNASEFVDGAFADTIPTIGQSLSVLRTSFLRFLDTIDDSTRISEAVARSIIAIAESLDFLLVGLLAGGAAFSALKLTTFIQGAFTAAAASRELAAAVAAGNATLLTATGIEQAKAASALQAAQANAANAASKVREIQVNNTALTQQIVLLRQQQASIVIDNQRLIARDALTGRFIAYNAAVAQNIRTNRALLLTERALTAGKAQLTAATTAQTAATNALSAAQARSAAAGAAANTFTQRLSRAFPLLSGTIGIAARALSGLFALAAANPIGALITVIVATATALGFLSNRISITEDGVVKLSDAFIATFQLIGEAIAPVTSFFAESFSRSFNGVAAGLRRVGEFFGTFFGELLNVLKATINGLIALFVGGYNAVVAVWGLLPQAFERLGALAINGLLSIVDAGIEGIVQGVGDLLDFIGSGFEAIGLSNPFEGLLDGFSVDLERFLQDVPDAARDIGSIAADEFLGAFERDFVGEAFGAILTRAREIAEARLADLGSPGEGADTGTAPGSGSGSGSGRKTFAEIVQELTLQNELLRINSQERERLTAILAIEDQLKRSLSASERELIEALLQENQALTRAAEILDDIQEPMREYTLQVEALNRLLEEGRISQDQFTQSVRQTRIEFLNTQTDLASGFERGFLQILEKTKDVASQAEEIVTSAFDGMSQAIADLVVDGEADFGSLIRAINKQIVQLVVSQAFQTLFGGATGGGVGAGGNIFGSLFQGIGSLLGLQRGGSFTVGSGTSIAPIPNGGNDNRLVAFRAQDGEQVSVTPRGQSAGGNSQNVVVNFNITTPDANSFRQSESQIAAKAARIISQGQRNM